MIARLFVFAVLLFAVSAPAYSARGLGEGCSAFHPCGDGLSCQPGSQKCYHKPRQSGEPCSLGYSCGSGLSCQPGSQRCYHKPRTEGEPCSAGYGCGSGLTCEAGTQKCVGPGKVGDACHLTKPCGSGLSCQPGVQKCYHSPRLAGEPCVAGYGCGPNLQCQAGSQTCWAGYPEQQCVYNQAGYVLQVKWFADGTMTSKKTGDAAYDISATKPAIKTETITLGQKSCAGGKGSKNWAVLTIKGGVYARVAAIVATDIGAVTATGGCLVGAAALTAVTAGAGSVAFAGCEVVTDAAVGIIAEPSIIPNSKELFAVVQPPASGGFKPLWIVTYGTVFKPDTRTGRP